MTSRAAGSRFWVAESCRTLHAHRDADLDATAFLAHRAIHELAQQIVGTIGKDQRVKVHLRAVAAAPPKSAPRK